MSIKIRATNRTSHGLRKPGKTLARVLAENVRSMRHALDLSQEELAERCGMHRTYIGSVERAERNVTIGTLEALARALSVPVTSLLTRGGGYRDR